VLDPPEAIATPPHLIPALDVQDQLRNTWRAAPHELPAPGEAAALDRLHAWVRDRLAGYESGRERLMGDASSRLSQDLHFGLLSPREVESAVTRSGLDGTAFLRQLAWREFYHHLASHRAEGRGGGARPTSATVRSEADEPELVAAWRGGFTGIPVIDAGMRQLAATGWISNRARMLVAGFLTRHLLVDHRVGEAHFLRTLIDGDIPNNTGGWEWSAGVGVSPNPWFRIMNPVLQGRRFDPDGRWVARWVPELAGLPATEIHAPWLADSRSLARAGVVPGSNYPTPIIDLGLARQRALAVWRDSSTASAPPR
jgi:deoxyribodipyrimidine photo-lyase